jgi:hypothetical protein
MSFFKRRKKKSTFALQAEAATAGERPPAALHDPQTGPRELSPHNSEDRGSDGQEEINPQEISDMLDPELIGRTIKLVKADDWEEDLIETFPKETQILYENQRGYSELNLVH